jgi:hypothetical protein
MTVIIYRSEMRKGNSYIYNQLNQTISFVVDVMIRYSALVED